MKQISTFVTRFVCKNCVISGVCTASYKAGSNYLFVIEPFHYHGELAVSGVVYPCGFPYHELDGFVVFEVFERKEIASSSCVTDVFRLYATRRPDDGDSKLF